jgi:3-oxoisoapionate kinase
MKRLIAYYGDDFTGSTDVMEALASNGVNTVLFTRLPTPEEFIPFASHTAIGLAGTSRSQTPQWMDDNLPQAFAWLKSLGAKFTHYKVCSTFDSAPLVGNIGRATEIGAHLFNQPVVPLIVGAPQLKRYTFAGHLFAGYQGDIYRIDRHPVMSRHPVTPMHEADLRQHLAQQTTLPASLANLNWPENGIGILDVHDDVTQLAAGLRLLEWNSGFVTGSSGIEYALMKAMAKQGAVSGSANFAPLAPVRQAIVVSGSVSPTTGRQIRHALQHGFESIAVDAPALAQNQKDTQQKATAQALKILSEGKSPLIHTALGPSTDDGDTLNTIANGRKHIGEGLGAILKAVLETAGLRRAIVAGGDSSSHALGQLDIYALTTRMPLPATPGSPLCTAFSGSLQLNGFEIALKGGQVGGDDYFTALRDGKLK